MAIGSGLPRFAPLPTLSLTGICSAAPPPALPLPLPWPFPFPLPSSPAEDISDFLKLLHLTYFWKILQRYHWPRRFKYAQIFAKFSKPLFKKNWRCEIFLNWGLKKESSPMCCPRFTHGFTHNFQPVRSSRSISYSLRTNKYMIEGLKYIDLCTVKMMHYNILV